jgi:HK97 family phage portal protein
MSWFGRLLGREKKETKSVDVSPEMWAALNGGWGLPTKSGNTVSTTTAIQNMAFYRGVIAIAEGLAQLPVEIYRRSEKGSEPAVDHPLYDLLMHQPNILQDGFQFWRTTLMHTVGGGNGVSFKNVVNGQVRELIPVRPECVSIDLDHLYRATYDITLEKGTYVSVGQDQVFHLKGPSWAPHKGLDPAVVGRETLGLAQAMEEGHARLHANGSRPSGVLTTEQAIKDKDLIARLREQWRQSYAGVSKTGETAVLTNGLTWKPLSQTGVDSEHLDTRKHQIEEIARLLGIFPIMLGHAGDQSPTFASAEAFLAAHVRYSLQPLIKNVRSAIETQLLTKEERAAGYHVRIDTSELLRGSLKDRTDYYKAALGTNSSPGWLAVNEVREDDGWNPVEGEEASKPLTPKDYGMDGGSAGSAPPDKDSPDEPEPKEPV